LIIINYVLKLTLDLKKRLW